MGLITRVADKAGVLGSVVSAMGGAVCFPAIASLGAAIGLGFLSGYEGPVATMVGISIGTSSRRRIVCVVLAMRAFKGST